MAISERQDYAADCNCFHAFGNPCYTVYRDSDWRQIYMDVKLTIQERLKDLRLEKGWTLEQLEQETGISRSALGSYEKNEYKDISHSAIIKLAETYDISADYLLGLTENRKMINTPLSELHLNDEMISLQKKRSMHGFSVRWPRMRDFRNSWMILRSMLTGTHLSRSTSSMYIMKIKDRNFYITPKLLTMVL